MRRWPKLLYMLLALWLPCNVHPEVLITPADDKINYYGRFDMSDANEAVRFNWPGSCIEAVFSGSTIGVELNDGGGSYFNVEIDGTVVDTLTPSSTTRRIITADLPADSKHTIRIILRTNGKDCSFGGFYLDDGNGLGDKPERPVRKMEFIGDSWTAGDVVGSTTSNDLKYFNACLTYARMTSKAYHAQDILVARGGCGLVNGYGATMENRYPQTLCDKSGEWDFSTWIPDVVVMCLGINDFNNGTADGDFITAYRRLITTVRNNYTDVPIILIGLDENQNGHNILNNVKEVANSFSDIRTFSSPVRLSNARALWQHPTPAQHREIADALIPVIAEATGWDTVPPVKIHKKIKENKMFHPHQNQRLVATTTEVSVTHRFAIIAPNDRSDENVRGTVNAYDLQGRQISLHSRGIKGILIPSILSSPGTYILRPDNQAEGVCNTR